MANIHETAQRPVPALGAPNFSPATQAHWESIRVTIVTGIMIADASRPRTDVSHIDRMSDETIQDLMDQPQAPRASLRSTPRTIFKDVPQVIATGIGVAAVTIVAPTIFEDQQFTASAQEPTQEVPSQEEPTQEEPSLGASFEPNLSPVPSEDPRTALLDCEPEAEPSPSLKPEPTPRRRFGYAPGEGGVLFTQGQTSDGSIVNITLAQAKPSIVPSLAPSLEPLPSPDPRTALVDPDCPPTPSASPIPSPEPSLNPDEFTLQWLIDQGYDPINKGGFMTIVNEEAPAILKHTRIDPELDTIEEIVADYERVANDLIANPEPRDFPAQILALSINNHINTAKQTFESNPQVAVAKFRMADALRKLGQKFIKFTTDKGKRVKNPNQIDKAVDTLILINK